MTSTQPTEDRPFYRKVEMNTPGATRLFMITVDEGWRSSILCERMYGWAADWLVDQIQGRRYAPEARP